MRIDPSSAKSQKNRRSNFSTYCLLKFTRTSSKSRAKASSLIRPFMVRAIVLCLILNPMTIVYRLK